MNLKKLISVVALSFVAPGVSGPGRVAVAASHVNDPDTFDPYKPGAYLNGKTFHVPAGASFAWQAWESPQQRVGAILVNSKLEQALIKIEHIELARPDDHPDSLVLNQYTLTVNPDVATDSILEIKTGGGAGVDGQTDTEHHWAFGFVLHIEPADKYMMLLKKLNVI